MTNSVDTSAQVNTGLAAYAANHPASHDGAGMDMNAALGFLADAIKQGSFDGIQIDRPGPIDIWPRPPIGMLCHPPFMWPPLSGMIERLLVALTRNDVASHGKEIDTNHDGVVSLLEYTKWSGQDKGSSPLRTAAFAEVAQLNPGQDSEGQLGVRIEGIDTIINRPPMVMKGEDGPMTRELRAYAGEMPVGELLPKLMDAISASKLDPQSGLGQLVKQLLLTLTENELAQHGTEMDANQDGVVTLPEFAKGKGDGKLSGLGLEAFAEAVQRSPGADGAGQLGFRTLESVLLTPQPMKT